MEKSLGQIVTEMKEDLSSFVELKMELLRLTAYERAGKLTSSLSYVLAITVLAFFATFFLFLALGFLLGEFLGSTGAGMAIIGGIYLLAIGILIMNKNRFSEKIMNNVIEALSEGDEEKKNESSYEDSSNPSGTTQS